MQLQQRIITSGPIDIATPPPLNPSNAFGRPIPLAASANNRLGAPVRSAQKPPELHDTPFMSNGSQQSSNLHQYPAIGSQYQAYAHHSPARAQFPSNGPLTPPVSPIPPHYSPHRNVPQGYIERVDSEPKPPSSSDGRSSSQSSYPSIRSTNKPRSNFFGFGKKTKVEKTDPLLDNGVIARSSVADSAKIAYPQRPSITESTSTASSSFLEPDNPGFNPWHDHDSPSSGLSPKPFQGSNIRTESSWSSISRSIAGAPTLNGASQKILLPSEANKFAGFCKGAWRQQIGDRKKAMEDRLRPGGMYNASKFWQCKHCKFEGRLVPLDRKRNGYDMRVFKLVEGIQFRWEFLFKSHLPSKDSSADPTKATFGCIFCCAEGRGASNFDGVQMLMEHLAQHRDPLPIGEVLYRMNCVVGHQANVEEDFDINFVGRSGVAY